MNNTSPIDRSTIPMLPLQNRAAASSSPVATPTRLFQAAVEKPAVPATDPEPIVAQIVEDDNIAAQALALLASRKPSTRLHQLQTSPGAALRQKEMSVFEKLQQMETNLVRIRVQLADSCAPQGGATELVLEDCSVDTIKLVVQALRDPACRITILRLKNLSAEAVTALLPALRDPNCKINALSLENLSTEAVTVLVIALRDPACKINALRLQALSEAAMLLLLNNLWVTQARTRKFQISAGNPIFQDVITLFNRLTLTPILPAPEGGPGPAVGPAAGPIPGQQGAVAEGGGMKRAAPPRSSEDEPAQKKSKQ